MASNGPPCKCALFNNHVWLLESCKLLPRERVSPQLHLGLCMRCIVYITSRLVYNVRVFFFVPFCRKKAGPKIKADDLPQTPKLVWLLPRSNLTTFLETQPKCRLHTTRATCDLVAQPAAYVGWSALSRDHFWPYFSWWGVINTEYYQKVELMYSWCLDQGYGDNFLWRRP